MNQPPQATLLSSIQYFQKHKYLSRHVVHPFANSAEETCDELQDLIQRADQLFDSLNFYTTSSWTSSRLISLLHQHATQEQELNIVRIVLFLSRQPTRYLVARKDNRPPRYLPARILRHYLRRRYSFRPSCSS